MQNDHVAAEGDADWFIDRLGEIPGVKRLEPMLNTEYVYKPGDRVVFEYNSPGNTGTVVKAYPPGTARSKDYNEYIFPEGVDEANSLSEATRDWTYDVKWDHGMDPKTYELNDDGQVGPMVNGSQLWPEGDVRLDMALRDPHGPKLSMALNPEDMQKYIAENGPYMEHWTKPEKVRGILERGILPGTHDTVDPEEDEWGYDDEYEPPGPGDIRRNWDGFTETRPYHTYLATPGAIQPGAHENRWGDRPYQVPVRVDLRKLDPKRLKADEDIARDNWPDWIENHPDENLRRYLQEEAAPPPDAGLWDAESNYGLGTWADMDAGLDDPWMTNQALYDPRGGALAHEGDIPPEAISLHPDYMDQYPEDAHKFDPNQMPLFDRTVAKTAKDDPDPDYSFMYYKSAIEVVPWTHNVRYREIAQRLLNKFNTRLEDGGWKDDEGEWSGGDIYVQDDGLRVEFKHLANPEIQSSALQAIRHWYDNEMREKSNIDWEMEGEETRTGRTVKTADATDDALGQMTRKYVEVYMGDYELNEAGDDLNPVTEPYSEMREIDDDDYWGSPAEQAAKIISDEGCNEASSSDFHRGIWYSGHSTNPYTGLETETTCHLKGFTPEEEREAWAILTASGDYRNRSPDTPPPGHPSDWA